MIATDNTTFVAYVNKQGGTHFHALLQLVVDLFLWLQTRGHNSSSQTHSGLPQCDSRLVISAEPAHHNRVESPPRDCESDIQTVRNSSSGHVCHSPLHASLPVYVSSSIALSTGDRCPVTVLAREVDVHVFTISPAQQSHSEAQDPSGGPGDTRNPLVAVCVWTVQTSFRTAETCCHNRDILVSQAPSRTICTHEGSHAALPRSRIFEKGLLAHRSF